ncbi:YqgE/AlgH family protein [Cognatishimia sp. SS12]|uniref:YqgE/AlgH family protein n=1 Tax=Cognatishimia sp. SS12 TaxID=2979465 RepID=UPI0023304C83|nr:YqgE/AlgH family protein [Cognatishimia sp. SS12]MDC0739093.1 YqgE/AlgH family protein [Cognatishimia sp. SS12]
MLIAMPGMGDPRFAHSIVYLCAHNDDGAMGLIVNKTMGSMQFSDLLEQLSIAKGHASRDFPLHFGGPVESGRGFVLHSADYRSEISTLEVKAGFAMTATLDVLEDMAEGGGPDRAILALGYSGWGPGQLEAEIADNGWLICDPALELVFDTADDQKWGAALNTLGIDPLTLSASAGHA